MIMEHWHRSALGLAGWDVSGLRGERNRVVRPYRLRLNFTGFRVKPIVYGLELMTVPLNCLFITLRLQNADIREVPVVIRVIEAVADDEFIRDLEAAHVGLVALGMARRFVEE